MNAWADLESEMKPEPRFHIDERDGDPATEIERQVAFRRECRRRLPSVRLVAIPNGAARGMVALNRARREGAAWGFPDIMALAPGLAAFLEFKNGKAKPEDHQIEWLNDLTRLGFPCGVFRREESAIAFLIDAGFPVRELEGK